MTPRVKPGSIWEKCKAGSPAIRSFLSQAIWETLCVEPCRIKREILVTFWMVYHYFIKLICETKHQLLYRKWIKLLSHKAKKRLFFFEGSKTSSLKARIDFRVWRNLFWEFVLVKLERRHTTSQNHPTKGILLLKYDFRIMQFGMQILLNKQK